MSINIKKAKLVVAGKDDDIVKIVVGGDTNEQVDHQRQQMAMAPKRLKS